MPDEAFITRPMDDGERQKRTDPLFDAALAAVKTAFPFNDQGWEAGQGALEPDPNDKRTFRVVEPYVWIWDRRTDTTSPFVELPDADTYRVGVLAGAGPPAGTILERSASPGPPAPATP